MSEYINTYYRLGEPREIGEHPDGRAVYERPVNIVYRYERGKVSLTKMEKEVAANLTVFRREFPDTPVEGAPTWDEAQLLLDRMSTEELARLGYVRERVDNEIREWFASEAAFDLAVSNSLPAHLFSEGGGTGQDGGYVASDVRELLEDYR